MSPRSGELAPSSMAVLTIGSGSDETRWAARGKQTGRSVASFLLAEASCARRTRAPLVRLVSSVRLCEVARAKGLRGLGVTVRAHHGKHALAPLARRECCTGGTGSLESGEGEHDHEELVTEWRVRWLL